MHPFLSKRFEMPWARFAQGLIVLLSLPLWALIVAAVPHREWLEDDPLKCLIAFVVCCVCTSSSLLVLHLLRGDSVASRSTILLAAWAVLPVAIMALLGPAYLFYVFAMDIFFWMFRGLFQ
jgi:hypothetical protein